MVDRDTSRRIEQVCFSCKICPCGATTGVTSGVAGRFLKDFSQNRQPDKTKNERDCLKSPKNRPRI